MIAEDGGGYGCRRFANVDGGGRRSRDVGDYSGWCWWHIDSGD